MRDVIRGRRFIYHIQATGFEPGQGHRVSIVVENESGHFPTGGGDTAPWYWGDRENESKSFVEATELAARKNAELGYSETQIADILTSSMRLSFGRMAYVNE